MTKPPPATTNKKRKRRGFPRHQLGARRGALFGCALIVLAGMGEARAQHAGGEPRSASVDLAVQAAAALEAQGRIAEAADLLRRLPASDARVGLRLAALLEKLQRYEEAIDASTAVSRATPPDSPERIEALKRVGNLSARIGRSRQAGDAFRHAFEDGGAQDPELMRSAVTAYLSGKLGTEALRFLRTVPETSPLHDEALRLTARALAEGRRGPEAAAAYANLVRRGVASRDDQLAYGLTLRETGRCAQALEVFASPALRSVPAAEMYRGYCLIDLGRRRDAENALRAALAHRTGLTSQQRADALGTLGYLLAEGGRHGEAAAIWGEAQEVRPKPAIALARVRSLRLAGREAEAKAAMEAVDPARMEGAAVAQYFDERAVLHEATGELETAIKAADDALSRTPTHARRLRLARLLSRQGRDGDAEKQYRAAVADRPDDVNARLELAYLYRRQGRNLEAIDEFQKVLRRDPQGSVHEELGYTLKTVGRRREAAMHFREAIDAMDAGASPPPREEDRRARLRREVAQTGRMIVGWAYGVYRSQEPTTGTNPVGAATGASQIGAEIGAPLSLRSNASQDLLIYGRTYAGFQPDSLRLDANSTQLGVGIRYRPFPLSNFYVGSERLIKWGANSRNDWLLSAGYSFSQGVEDAPGARVTNYTSINASIAYIPGRQRAVYADVEALQGIAWTLSSTTALIPHAVLAAQYTKDGAVRRTNVEVGVGVRYRILLNESRYESGRMSLSLDLQYRQHVLGNQRAGGGVVVRFVTGF